MSYITISDFSMNTNTFKAQLQKYFKVKIQSLKRKTNLFYTITINNIKYSLSIVKSGYYYHVYID